MGERGGNSLGPTDVHNIRPIVRRRKERLPEYKTHKRKKKGSGRRGNLIAPMPWKNDIRQRTFPHNAYSA